MLSLKIKAALVAAFSFFFSVIPLYAPPPSAAKKTTPTQHRPEKRSHHPARMTCLDCDADPVTLQENEWYESVENSQSASTRTVYLDKPEAENAYGMEIRYDMPGNTASTADVDVEVKNSIFGADAEVVVIPDPDNRQIIVRVLRFYCNGVTADGLAMKVKITGLGQGQADQIQPSGDTVILIIPDF